LLIFIDGYSFSQSSIILLFYYSKTTICFYKFL